MITRIQENTAKGIFIIVLYIFLLLQGLLAGAQSYRPENQNSYRGFVASFGVRSADLSSNDAYDFIHPFSEVRYGKNLSSKSSNLVFSNIQINSQTQLIVGISFGAHR